MSLLAVNEKTLLAVEDASLRLSTPESGSAYVFVVAGTIFVHWFIRDDVISCATVNSVIRRGKF
jgi:hypothetical protein